MDFYGGYAEIEGFALTGEAIDLGIELGRGNNSR